MVSRCLTIRQELKFLAHRESGLKPTPEPVLTGFRYEAGILIPDGLGGTAAIPSMKMQHIFGQLSRRITIRQELKFLAHSESGLKPTPEPVLTGFRYEAGISIPDGLGGTAALPILLEAWGAASPVSNQLGSPASGDFPE